MATRSSSSYSVRQNMQEGFCPNPRLRNALFKMQLMHAKCWQLVSKWRPLDVSRRCALDRYTFLSQLRHAWHSFICVSGAFTVRARFRNLLNHLLQYINSRSLGCMLRSVPSRPRTVMFTLGLEILRQNTSSGSHAASPVGISFNFITGNLHISTGFVL